ncbi:MAG: hypothetical protein M0Z80_01235 [Treponema sp.]|nr:hypothetical protein [Treponema sp.]
MLVSFSGPQSTSELGAIMDRDMTVELDRAGLTIVSGRGAEAAAGAGGIPYGFTCVAAGDKDVVRLSIALSDRASGRILASAELSEPVTLELDSRLAAVVRRMLAQAGLDKLPPHGEAKPAALGAVEGKPRATKAASAAVPAATVSAMPPGSDIRSATIVPEGRAGPSLQVHAAPLLIVGGGSDYFQYGADVSLFVGGDRRFGNLSLGGGLRTDVARIFPAAAPGQGYVYLSTFGLEGRLTAPATGGFRFFVRAAGGPCLVAASPDSSSAELKVLPQATSSLGLSLGHPEGFTLDVDLGFYALFEREIPLMAFMPGLAAGWRL